MPANKKGFTLVELMIVLLIIAVLMAVSLVVFLGARKRAQDNGAKQVITNAAKAVSSYYASNKVVPAEGPNNGSNGDSLAEEEGTYAYSDAAVAPSVADPAAIAYQRESDDMATLRTTSQSSEVFKVTIDEGKRGNISSGN